MANTSKTFFRSIPENRRRRRYGRPIRRMASIRSVRTRTTSPAPCRAVVPCARWRRSGAVCVAHAETPSSSEMDCPKAVRRRGLPLAIDCGVGGSRSNIRLISARISTMKASSVRLNVSRSESTLPFHWPSPKMIPTATSAALTHSKGTRCLNDVGREGRADRSAPCRSGARARVRRWLSAYHSIRMGTSRIPPGRTAAIALRMSLARRRTAGQAVPSRTTTPIRLPVKSCWWRRF